MVTRKIGTKPKSTPSTQRATAKPLACDLPGRLSSHRSLLSGFSAEDLTPYLDAPEAEGPIDARKRARNDPARPETR
jgi:hypothetical protein